MTVAAAGYITVQLYALAWPRQAAGSTLLSHGTPMLLIGALLAPVVLRDSRLEVPAEFARVRGMLGRAVARVFMLLGMLLAISFLTRLLDDVPRLWVLMWAATIFGTTIAGRVMLGHRVGTLERNGALRERIAVLGSGPGARALVRHLRNALAPRVQIVGVWDHDLDDPHLDDRAMADLDEVVALGQRHGLDRVLIVPPAVPTGDLEQGLAWRIQRLKSLDVQVALCPNLIGFNPNAGRFDRVGDVPVLQLVNRPMRHWGLVLKELEDKVLGGLLLIALLPLLAAIALAVRIDSRGPVIFRQKRHGLNNTEFEVFKFRTMTFAADSGDGKVQTQRGDKRITRVGGFLRRSSLDELPQLMNVLRGEMSLVGPRPHPVVMRTEDRLGTEILAEYAHRHRVKPGITGWAQINGYRGATETAEQVRRRVELDIEYIERWTILFDLRILLLTPIRLLTKSENAF